MVKNSKKSSFNKSQSKMKQKKSWIETRSKTARKQQVRKRDLKFQSKNSNKGKMSIEDSKIAMSKASKNLSKPRRAGEGKSVRTKQPNKHKDEDLVSTRLKRNRNDLEDQNKIVKTLFQKKKGKSKKKARSPSDWSIDISLESDKVNNSSTYKSLGPRLVSNDEHKPSASTNDTPMHHIEFNIEHRK